VLKAVERVVQVARRATEPLEEESRLGAVSRAVVHELRDGLGHGQLQRVAPEARVAHDAVGVCIGQSADVGAERGVRFSERLAPRRADRLVVPRRSLAPPSREPDPLGGDDVAEVCRQGAEVGLPRLRELLGRQALDRRQDALVRPLVGVRSLTQGKLTSPYG